MNFFLLLKNELSLHFLRQTENMVQTLKLAIRIHAGAGEQARTYEETMELKALDKLLSGAGKQMESDDEDEEKKAADKSKPPAAALDKREIFEKIVAKLLDYNDRINQGKEICVTEFFKRVDQRSDWLHAYANQRHLRRAFFEEYKIHSLNFILLLFESIVRMLTTIHRESDDEEGAKGTKRNPDGENEDKQFFYSKNYKRFLEHRAKKLDNFIVNCIGWSHVLRCVEVLEMAMRELVFKVVPIKVIVRELKTTSGKVLTKDSEYILVEKKKYVTVGKKTQIDYCFELDIKEPTTNDADKEAKNQKAAKEAQERERSIFYMNLNDFSLFKLKSVVYLVQFPLMFALSIMSCWSRIMPSSTSSTEKYTKEELDLMN